MQQNDLAYCLRQSQGKALIQVPGAMLQQNKLATQTKAFDGKACKASLSTCVKRLHMVENEDRPCLNLR